jgi:hypothetical protein
MIMKLKLPSDNRVVPVSCMPLHRKYQYWNKRTGIGRRAGIYKRPTDWIVRGGGSGINIAWGRTRRGALANLRDMLDPDSIPF